MARIDIWKRGYSYWRLVLRHTHSTNTCANGLAEEILKRYLRMSKFTCLDRGESMRRINGLISSLDLRHPTTYHFGKIIFMLVCDGNEVWIDGRLGVVDPEKLGPLRRLEKVVSKIDLASAKSRAA